LLVTRFVRRRFTPLGDKLEDMDIASAEERRWTYLLGSEFAISSLWLAVTFASGIGWFVLPAVLAVPIVGPLTLVYLAMSSDTNDPAKR
jgi:hypothetical protein